MFNLRVTKVRDQRRSWAFLRIHNKHSSRVPDQQTYTRGSHGFDKRYSPRVRRALALIDVPLLDCLIVGETVTSLAERAMM